MRFKLLWLILKYKDHSYHDPEATYAKEENIT